LSKAAGCLFCWGLYLLLNIGYSLGLKQVPLVDVVILASGYVIRVFYGGAVVGAAVSSWLYLTILFFSLFLGLGKRRNELLRQGDQSRAVLKHYPPAFLDRMMYMCLTLTVVFYSFWCIDPEVAAQYSPVGLTASIPLLVLVFYEVCNGGGGGVRWGPGGSFCCMIRRFWPCAGRMRF
jgi:decaprenyl-phosphate phosphoribosyltransferase